MKLEALVTSVDYGDFLSATLPTNRSLFDRIVVVTSPEDEETLRLCEYWHVESLPTDAFRSRWGEFHKGAAINEGLSALDRDGWVLHLDADILLPPLARQQLEQAQLDTSCIYGVDRHQVPNVEAFLGHMASPRLQQEDDIYVHLNAFPLLPRISTSRHDGYMPIGFFQLWHPDGSGQHHYPRDHDGANRTDTMFAAGWPRARRQLLPEIVAYHLESEPAEQGANWAGRTTQPFGHCHPPRRHHRHHHHRPHPYRDDQGAA